MRKHYFMVEIAYIEFNNNVPVFKAARLWSNTKRQAQKLAKSYAKSPECHSSAVYQLIDSEHEGDPAYLIVKKWEYSYKTWRNLLNR